MLEQVKRNIKKHEYHMAFFYAFVANGWEDMHTDDDESTYKLRIAVCHNNYVYAKVSTNKNGYHAHCDYGVEWLEHEYEYADNSLGYGDIDVILKDMEMAEENLLTLGIPFSADYKFHGKNKANKKRMNAKIRRVWELEVKNE